MMQTEDDFWAEHARDLVRRAGGGHRVALVVREGRVVSQALHTRGAHELTAIALASPRARGGSLYVAHLPDPRAIELARRTQVAALVLAGTSLEADARAAWEIAGVRVRILA